MFSKNKNSSNSTLNNSKTNNSQTSDNNNQSGAGGVSTIDETEDDNEELQSPESRKIKLSSIVEICRGVQTEVMRLQKNMDPVLSVSLVTADRTLDMSFSSPWETDSFVQTLQALLIEKNVYVRYLESSTSSAKYF